jgi:hypothetical protein
MSIASLSLKLSGLYEAELLIELMLRHWKHPFATDDDFRNAHLERAAEALRSAVAGQPLLKDLPAEKTNLVVAIWYAEWTALDLEGFDGNLDPTVRDQRQEWLDMVRRTLPACFCSPDLLP